jgi:signal transduction histidine kinase/PAS domain-containing protein/ActR/RegA family two-component response regulator
MSAWGEDELLKAVALRNASSILKARQRAEQELLDARDALERKTEELALSLAMMKATLDSATDGILVTDARRRVTGYNEKFVEMWRLPSGALESRDHGEVLDSVSEWFERPQEHRRLVDAIYHAAPPASFDLLRPVEGRIVGRVWSYRDITEQRRAEEALRDETRVLELLNRTGRNLVSRLDLRSLVQAVTDAATQICGAKFGSFFYNTTDEKGDALLLYTISGAPREAFAHLGNPRSTAIFGPTFRGEAPIRSDDIRKDPRYGKWGPHHGMPPGHLPVRSYLAVPVIGRSGEAIGGLFFGHPEPGMFNERSEKVIVGVAAQAAVAIENARMYEAAQKAAEERKLLLESERSARALAERMSALKDDFLSVLSHELRAPLSVVLGWAHVLRRGGVAPQDLRRGLDTIERNSRLQIRLLDDLLDRNRIVSGKVRLDIRPVEPIEFVQTALDEVRPAADAKGVTIECALDASAGPVPGDQRRLQQVVSQLLSNAVKFTPPGGTIKVALEREESQVLITVADSGDGISPTFLQHVFDLLPRSNSPKDGRAAGMGLGLAIVKRLVALHGGAVHVTSDGHGRGTTFSISLPNSAASATLAASSAGAALNHHGPQQSGTTFLPMQVDLSGLKVLVVDDDDDGRDLALRVLHESRADVLGASNAQDALNLVALHRPHVMVSDLRMPEVDGFTLLKQVRSLGEAGGGALPVVAFTAYAGPESRQEALRAGFAAHLAKPAEPPALLATVASAAAGLRPRWGGGA